ncbi:glucose-6-phosphate isomerase [Sedimentisphaera cyanobacteriorum]|uniref:Glucose-6-phosphate isomerase n=1 Tax=Sedimentisphaera cyanobacteriorum TaxID=1940790 RepID=A0A1Q2HMM9_9BACT|nr:hypothetical protein [Sedimentisphaera cyanobacteriorum]AQQ08717.1 glucose-6-phosphate isomerase [Sedimentisphaera cyanobacteriorum]
MEIIFSGTGYSSSINVKSFSAARNIQILQSAKDVIYNCNKNRNEDKSPLRDFPYNQDNFDWIEKISEEYKVRGKKLLIIADSKEIGQIKALSAYSKFHSISLKAKSLEQTAEQAGKFTAENPQSGIIFIPAAASDSAPALLEKISNLDSQIFVFSESISDDIKNLESKKIVLKKMRIFSPLGLPGLLAGEFMQLDIGQLLSGARKIDSFLGREAPQKNPAAIFASVIYHSRPEKNGLKFGYSENSLHGICEMCKALMGNNLTRNAGNPLTFSFGIGETEQSDIRLVIDELSEYKLGMLIYFLQTASTMLKEFSNL